MEDPKHVDPKHVAFIMDGNSMWAKKKGLSAMDGYIKGIKNMVNIIICSKKLMIPYVTFYAFSTENWNRPPDWVKKFMKLLKYFFSNNEELNKLKKEGANLKIIGNVEKLDCDIRKKLLELAEESKNNTGIYVTVAIGYGSRDEIVRAARKLQHNNIEITEDVFSSYLDTYPYPDPDIVIRSSGKQRISNFLLWQISYSELYFSDADWPAFCEDDLKMILNDFSNRERTYGS